MAQTDSAPQPDPQAPTVAVAAPETTHGHSAKDNVVVVYAMFLGGIALIGCGLWLVISGFTSRPPSADGGLPAVVVSPAEPTSQQIRYRMMYSEYRKAWQIKDIEGNGLLWLPENAFPWPGLYNPPSRPMLAGEIRESLLAAMVRNHFSLSREQFTQLAGVSLDGQPLFPDLEPLKDLVPDKAGLDRAGASALDEREAETVADIDSTPVRATPIPPAYDPNARAFNDGLKDWAAALRQKLAKTTAKGRYYTVAYTNPVDDKPITMKIHERVRQPMLSTAFGDQNADKAAYLQALLCHHGFKLTVDGQIGPGTKKAIRSFATAKMPGREEAYLELVDSLVP